MMNFNYRLILGSESPRRKELLQQAGFRFETRKADVDETFDKELPLREVAETLAVKKFEFLLPGIVDEVIVTSDTVVIAGESIMNKPANDKEAIEMLQRLSGAIHEVITGVCIGSSEKRKSFSDRTLVSFKNLTDEEILYYVENFHPFDKAGAYGIQDWIGMIAIERIEGSFYTVMGLPVHRVYSELMEW